MKSVGIVGAGVIASQVHLPILLAMDDVRVAWITDANPVVSRSVAASHGVDAVSLEGGVSALTTVDVALIAIPLPPRPIYLDHFAGTETALLVEKPLANNVEEHRRLIAAYAPWRIAVGYQRRFYASFVAVRSFVMSGTLGPLRAIRVSEGGRTTRTDGAGQYQSLPVQSGGGIVKNLGCHALDLALWISDAAGFSIRRSEVSWDDETDQRCRAMIDLETRMGWNVELDFAMSWIDRMANRIEFCFESGTLSCPVAPSSEIELRSPAGTPIASVSVAGPSRATTPRQAYYLEWRALLDAASRKAPQSVSPAQTLLCAELIEALLESSRELR